MKRSILTIAFALLSGVVTSHGRIPALLALDAGNAHDYFDALVKRPEHWQSFSLRDQAQLETRANGGYANCNGCPLHVTYDPQSDPDPRRQDAAKVVVPAGRASLPNQVRLPMGTSDGNSYLVTWDAWFGAEYAIELAGIPQQKTFQFESDGIWYEIQTRFNLGRGSDGLGEVTARGYSGGNAREPGELVFGPNVTDTNPLPQVGHFMIRPERWTRYWALVEQRANDYDLASLWAADEQTEPVHVLDRIQLNTVFGKIDRFWLEFNTSTSPLEGRGPLVSYVRNVVMLRNVVNPTGLMQRPNAGTPLPPPEVLPGLQPPRNVRIIQQN